MSSSGKNLLRRVSAFRLESMTIGLPCSSERVMCSLGALFFPRSLYSFQGLSAFSILRLKKSCFAFLRALVKVCRECKNFCLFEAVLCLACCRLADFISACRDSSSEFHQDLAELGYFRVQD